MKRFLKNNRGNVLSIFLTLTGLIAFFVGIFIFGSITHTKLLLNFEATQTAKTYLSNHPQVKDTLGNITQWDETPSGDFYYGEWTGDGQVKFDLVGDKSKAKVIVEMIRDHQSQPWKVSQSTLVLSQKTDPINLVTPAEWLSHAYNALNLGNMDEAKEYCSLLKQATPEDERTSFCEAEVAKSEGNNEGYIDIVKTLAGKYPNYDRHQSKLGYAYWTIGDYEKSIESYKKAWDIYKDPETATRLAELDLDQKMNKEAFEWLEKASGMLKQRTAQLEYLYGRYFFNEKDDTKAIEYFNKSRAINALDDRPFFGMAYISQDLGNNSDAVHYFEQGISRNPQYCLKHRRNLVDLLLRMSYFDDAIYQLLKIIDYHPNEVGAFVVLSKLYARYGRNADAEATMTRAININAEEALRLSELFSYLTEPEPTEPAPEEPAPAPEN